MTLRQRQWTNWLSDLRLQRWNFLRERAGEEPITREQGGKYLASLAADRKNEKLLEEIKERIAE